MSPLLVALGDSLTAGYVNSFHGEPYTRFLDELIKEDLGIRVQIINSGLPGIQHGECLGGSKSTFYPTGLTISSSGEA
jgi:hypothetical protein